MSTLHVSPLSTRETLVLARKRRPSPSPSTIDWVLGALRRSALARRSPLSRGDLMATDIETAGSTNDQARDEPLTACT
ncbi:MAG: hypothetical protein M3Y09_16750, partial [Actinomycetota bacterium]|nr:hypothetical protein [Actinomycetota bacterium]